MNDLFKFTETTSTLSTKMAGEPELTGMAKHFNAVTFTGRANVAKVSKIFLALILMNILIYLGRVSESNEG